MPDLERIHKTASAYDAIITRKSPPPTMREVHEAQAAMNRALKDLPEPVQVKLPSPEEIKAMKDQAKNLFPKTEETPPEV